jgi:hypothetical protein
MTVVITDHHYSVGSSPCISRPIHGFHHSTGPKCPFASLRSVIVRGPCSPLLQPILPCQGAQASTMRNHSPRADGGFLCVLALRAGCELSRSPSPPMFRGSCRKPSISRGASSLGMRAFLHSPCRHVNETGVLRSSHLILPRGHHHSPTILPSAHTTIIRSRYATGLQLEARDDFDLRGSWPGPGWVG